VGSSLTDFQYFLITVMQFFTIGVFHSSEEEFFNKLTENRIDTFCDIRQRRSVRGSTYAFVNSTRLQEILSGLAIQYRYETGLAPTQAVREVQKKADLKKHELITERKLIDKAFSTEYKKKILDKFDFKSFIEILERQGSQRVVLFCVEEFATACHRSLVAEKLQKEFNFKVKNL
jgi:uncharacterized protein (DUF488 family)